MSDEEPEAAFSVWCGLDVGKQDHHACALDPAGKRLFDAPEVHPEPWRVPYAASRLRAVVS